MRLVSKLWVWVAAGGLVAAGLPPVGAQMASPWTAIARDYRRWSRIGNSALRYGPFDCPYADPPPVAQASRSRAARGSHAGKVYLLYTNDRRHYDAARAGRMSRALRGLTIVKEAFRPRRLSTDQSFTQPLPDPLGRNRDQRYNPVFVEGQWWGAGRPVGLYVLRFEGASSLGTDAGWTYATVGFDGRVRQSGNLPVCAGCHRRAGPGRLLSRP